MLKKSLKAGSIIVLLLSLLFFIGCSNAASDTPDPNTGPDGPNLPNTDPPNTDPPTPADPRVTNVTINQKEIEVGRGESYIFSARVDGVGAYDRTVVWAVLPPEAGEEPVLKTVISQKGQLTLDGGLRVGQDVWIQATAGGVSDIARVIVAPEGPYFTWEPGRIKRVAREAIAPGEVYGYLRGFSYTEKDIRLRVGLLEPNVDYTIAVENGVSGVGAILTTGDVLTVRGESTPYEGVSVTLNTDRITLDDPTQTGIIRVTMLPHAFFGGDVGELNPGRKSLVIEVSDNRAIDSLEHLDIDFAGTSTMPIQGELAPKGVFQSGVNEIFDETAHSGVATVTSYKSVFWDEGSISLGGNFKKQKDVDLVGHVTLRSGADTYFLKNFESNPAAISNATAFVDGSPVADKITVSADGRTLAFDLTYKIYSRILKDTATAPDIQLKTLIDTEYGFSDFSNAAPEHKDPLPPLIWTRNNYFDAAFVWSNERGGIETDDNGPVAFKAARLPEENYAIGTLTLTPKVGYTFEGTDLEIGNFNSVFTGTPVKTAVLGEEGSLILTFSYLVGEKEIASTDIIPENFETLIARPIHGKAVGVRSAFTATADSPYTGTVTWTAGTNPARNGVFSTDDTPNATALVTLKAKPGYKFDATGYSGDDAVFSAAVAVDGPNSTLGGTFGSALSDIYQVTVGMEYTSATVILQQITNLDGYSTDLDPVAGGSGATISAAAVTGSPFDGTQADGVILRGLDGSSNYQHLTDVRVIYTITPEAGYTFKADQGTYAYFAIDDPTGTPNGKTAAEKAAYIAGYFSQVYKGSIIPVAERVRVNVNGIYLNAGDELVLDLTYPAKPEVITDAEFTLLNLGDLSGAIAAGPVPNGFGPVGVSAKFKTEIAFYEDDGTTPADEFLGSTTYIAKITVTPKPGYTFVGTANDTTALGAIETAVEADGVYGDNVSSSVGSVAFDLAAADIAVQGFVVDVNEDPVLSAKDNIVISLKFDVP
jgi:hypothetical protein